MGQNATAYLCFGVALEADAIPYDEEAEDGPAWSIDSGCADESGVRVFNTCNEGVPRPIVAIASTVRSADWSGAVALSDHTDGPAQRAIWIARINAYLARWNLTTKVDRRTHSRSYPGPCWLLAARFA